MQREYPGDLELMENQYLYVEENATELEGKWKNVGSQSYLAKYENM